MRKIDLIALDECFIEVFAQDKDAMSRLEGATYVTASVTQDNEWNACAFDTRSALLEHIKLSKDEDNNWQLYGVWNMKTKKKIGCQIRTVVFLDPEDK